ncbi:hypothetical protein [Sulfitobacter sp.]|uniref:hypothetical protein n=1 Tax=Sulfitobacter sp. TaxID=1903071 RepID=UPI003002E622
MSIGADHVLRIGQDVPAAPASYARVQLSWSGETYEIEALPGSDIWVNGRKVGTALLLHGDMIEFGADGPMSRLRLCGNRFQTDWPVEEILSDAVAYARSSRRSFWSRLSPVAALSRKSPARRSSVMQRQPSAVAVGLHWTAMVIWLP